MNDNKKEPDPVLFSTAAEMNAYLKANTVAALNRRELERRTAKMLEIHRKPALDPVPAPAPVSEPKPVAKPIVKKKHAAVSAGVKRKSRPYCVSCGEEKPEAGTLHGWTHRGRGPGRSVWTCSEQCAEVYEDCQHQAQAISLKDVFG